MPITSATICWFIVGVAYNLLHCYIFIRLTNCDEKILLKGTIFFSVIFSLIHCYTIYHDLLYIRPVIIHICYVLIIFLSYKTTLTKTIMFIMLMAIISSTCEMIIGISFTTLFQLNLLDFSKTTIGILISNTICVLLILIITQNKKFKTWLQNFFKWSNNNHLFKLIFLTIVAILTVSMLLKQNIKEWNNPSSLLITNSFIICIVIFIVMYLKENLDKNRLISEYDGLLSHVKTYENLINEKNKNQHEYKNQLILLRGMVSPKNVNALNYIDEMLEAKNNDINFNWLLKLNNIPQGGLKGLIYYKINQMQEQGIEIFIDIDSTLEKEILWEVCNKNLRDVSRIIGVYIDNSIEAASKAMKKYVIIEAEYLENSLIFTFSNTYSGIIDINNIDSVGFSTKGKGKGFGLSLVNDILKKNNCLKQKREFNGIYYVQKLIISDDKSN